MLSFFGGALIFLLTLIIMIASIGIIACSIIFVGFVLEKTEEKHNGFFHRLVNVFKNI